MPTFKRKPTKTGKPAKAEEIEEEIELVSVEQSTEKTIPYHSEEEGDYELESKAIQKKVQHMNRTTSKLVGGFQAMGLFPVLLKAIQHKGFKIPTPIQRKTIPTILDGRDVVAMARYDD